ncbi:isochorismatase [bacterium]|nr:isochorismatase [bacterium]
MHRDLPVPPHFDPEKVGKVWRVPFQKRASEAEDWARKQNIEPFHRDKFKICLMAVDIQNTFCIPDFELFVGGRSGHAAVDDNVRLCRFIYRNLDVITQICPTMDTHQAMQIFHTLFWVNEKGEHPDPLTIISKEDVEKGRWKFNSNLAPALGVSEDYAQRYVRHYVKELHESGKYDLTVWPYHVILGSISHALVAAVEEAAFFHGIARFSKPNFQVKGSNPFTEHYSVLGPEVREDPDQKKIARKNEGFTQKLMDFDAVIIAGQAKSHCVAWTIDDLLEDITVRDKRLAEKVYLLEDCTSPVVVPGVVDYTEKGDQAFQRFQDAGMHLVRSTDPIHSWPDIKL